MGTLNKILGLPDDDSQGTLTQQTKPAVQPPVQQKPVQTNEGTTQPTATPQPVNEGSAVVPSTQTPTAPATPPPAATPTLTQQGAGKTHMSYVEMMQQMSPYKPPTDEELAKERKKQKRDAVFAAIGDGLAAFNQAYANARGIKPVAAVGMSDKVRNRYEKLKKERDAQSREYMNAYMKAMQADDEAERDARNWRRTLERDVESDRRDQRDFDNRVQQQKQQFDRQGEQWAKQFEESKRQFNVSSAQAQQRINMESKRLSQAMQSNNVTFALGTGKGTISVPTSALNASNVAFVFSKLPEEVRATVQGEAIYDSKKRKIVGHKDPTTDAMLVCIGANIENSPEAQDALRELAGKKQPGDDGGNTPPSRRGNNNDNTPPSRR